MVFIEELSDERRRRHESSSAAPTLRLSPADEAIVLRVVPDPEPCDVVTRFDRDRSIVQPDGDRSKAAGFLEVQ
jgi:hypothetical protein